MQVQVQVATLETLKGTHTLPVLGWMQKGAFSKWFIPLDTAISSLMGGVRRKGGARRQSRK